jgi:hypothetical protein
MKRILIYANCAGGVITGMFQNHEYTKDKFSVTCIWNYENLHKQQLEDDHLKLLQKCDIFIYQPFNRNYDYSEYDISNIKKYLKNDVTIIKVNYYRFKGFWYDSTYKPFNEYKGYLFSEDKNFGLHNSFQQNDNNNNNNKNKNEIIDKIDNLQFIIEKDKLLEFFNSNLESLKIIDDNSDVDMYDFFINNYKNKHLFHDPFHPTHLFFYEIFRQLVFKLTEHILPNNDDEFIKSLNHTEMTHWALPVLPIVKKHLELNLPDKICVFYPNHNPQKLYMTVYDYYYIRLSTQNFDEYLNNL